VAGDCNRDASTLGSFPSAGATLGQSSLSLQYWTNQSNIAREYPHDAAMLGCHIEKVRNFGNLYMENDQGWKIFSFAHSRSQQGLALGNP
jgi:hypothetical protein